MTVLKKSLKTICFCSKRKSLVIFLHGFDFEVQILEELSNLQA